MNATRDCFLNELDDRERFVAQGILDVVQANDAAREEQKAKQALLAKVDQLKTAMAVAFFAAIPGFGQGRATSFGHDLDTVAQALLDGNPEWLIRRRVGSELAIRAMRECEDVIQRWGLGA